MSRGHDNNTQRMEQSYDTVDPANLIEKLRACCMKRGVSGIKSMGRAFRLYDKDRNRTLSFPEFKQGLQNYGAIPEYLNQEEVKMLFAAFDKDGGGHVDYEEFLLSLRPPMNSVRIELIDFVFDKIDSSGNAVISIEEMGRFYNEKAHPKFKSGDWSRNQVIQEFMNSFQPGAHKDDKITRAEFHEYYAGVSASIDKDVYFDFMIRQAWNFDKQPVRSAETFHL